ncbi:MAG: hypothetical protein JST54_34650 [Deltaproteobacteria bacterium]|nr:hypothetical protein [Deltaproteobacteria bacterium]
MPVLPQELKQRIAAAKAELEVAERELAAALQAITATDRAEKTMIAASLTRAFQKLAEGKRVLAELLAETQ